MLGLIPLLAVGALPVAGDSAIAAPSRPSVAMSTVPVQSLVVESAKSTVRLVARGDAPAEVARRATNLRHSALEPAGRFVQAGQSVTVTLPAGTTGVEVAIGLYGAYAAFNGGADQDLARTALTATTTTVTADRSGLVYLTRGPGAPVTATVTGGVAVPTFVLGTTTKRTFDRSVAQFSSAPFVTIVGKRIIADLQRGVVTANLSKVTDALVASWDSVVAKTDAIYGLLDVGASAGAADASAGRIHLTNPDDTVGYAAATNDRIIFPVAYNSAADLLQRTASNQWALWHEIGHTYQSPLYSWDGLGEVTANISSLSIQESLGAANRLDDAALRTALAQWRTTPVEQRSFDAIDDIWMKTLMFDQLRRGFGANFYPHLHQAYRVAQAMGEQPARTTTERQQRFMRIASAVAQRDLTPFFRQWGLFPDAATTAAIAGLPPLSRQIWNNHRRSTDVVERTVPAYAVPTGSLQPGSTMTARLGESVPPTGLVTSTGNSDGMGTTSVIGTSLIATEVGPAAGRIVVLLQNSRGTRNVLVRPVAVTPGTAFELRGYADYHVGTLALARDTRTVRAWSTGTQIHPYVTDRTYLAVALRAADGTVLAMASATGAESADAFAAALDGVPYASGQYLVVDHLEPAQRLLRYDLDALQPASTALTQAFRISGDGLVAVPLAEVPTP